MTLAIGYEDGDLVVVDKPGGMHVHPIGAFRADTVLNALLAHAGARADQPWAAWRPHPVHRLDRATAASSHSRSHAAIHKAMCALFDADRVHRTYRATVDRLMRRRRRRRSTRRSARDPAALSPRSRCRRPARDDALPRRRADRCRKRACRADTTRRRADAADRPHPPAPRAPGEHRPPDRRRHALRDRRLRERGDRIARDRAAVSAPATGAPIVVRIAGATSS